VSAPTGIWYDSDCNKERPIEFFVLVTFSTWLQAVLYSTSLLFSVHFAFSGICLSSYRIIPARKISLEFVESSFLEVSVLVPWLSYSKNAPRGLAFALALVCTSCPCNDLCALLRIEFLFPIRFPSNAPYFTPGANTLHVYKTVRSIPLNFFLKITTMDGDLPEATLPKNT